MRTRPPQWQADLALGGMALIWGATFVLVKNALADVSPTFFLAMRFTIAAVVLGAVLRPRRAQWTRSAARGALGVGIFLCAGYILQTAGLLFTTPSKSGFLTGLYIPLVPLFAGIVYKSVPQTSESIGAVVAAAGLVLLTWPGELARLNRGDILTTGCAVAFGFHLMAIDHYTKREDYRLIAVGQIATAAAACWLFAPLLDGPIFVRWSGAVVAALAITSLLATALAFLLMTWAQQFTTPTRAAVILALEPVFAWLASYIWAGERLSSRAAAGATLILAGILLAELKPLGKRTHQEA